MWSDNILGLKVFKSDWSEKKLSLQLKHMKSENFGSEKKSWSKKNWGQKKFGPEKCWV